MFGIARHQIGASQRGPDERPLHYGSTGDENIRAPRRQHERMKTRQRSSQAVDPGVVSMQDLGTNSMDHPPDAKDLEQHIRSKKRVGPHPLDQVERDIRKARKARWTE